MQLKVLEKKSDSMKLEVAGETHTLLNLLRENSWKTGAKQSSYSIKHPYLSQPEIFIVASDPKKVLVSSAQMVVDQAHDFGLAFKRASKR